MTSATLPQAAPTTRRPSRRRAGAFAALALAAVMLFAACTPEANRTADLINQERAQRGIPALQFNTMLYLKAQGWADHLSRQGHLSHSNLTNDNWSTTWRKLGENVGVAGSIEGAHQAFMNSKGHRDNILDRGFNKVGTGVTRGADGRVWVVHEFMYE
ncbi:CAP domain-containing protein [Rhabdothermincola salaria]|uniref:CAP domain-containing protein n=1 Tax=Rhabdothermincola salaria TaxID=2903142 RepID=UPI001E6193CA|nr:CAP domain-containing protein [Rhabdothermincola salaria]MCD9623774.1 CAP domain-containing protein [Rhabdothermincola salaria]